MPRAKPISVKALEDEVDWAAWSEETGFALADTEQDIVDIVQGLARHATMLAVHPPGAPGWICAHPTLRGDEFKFHVGCWPCLSELAENRAPLGDDAERKMVIAGPRRDEAIAMFRKRLAVVHEDRRGMPTTTPRTSNVGEGNR